jgi:hypothetical protein
LFFSIFSTPHARRQLKLGIHLSDMLSFMANTNWSGLQRIFLASIPFLCFFELFQLDLSACYLNYWPFFT